MAYVCSELKLWKPESIEDARHAAKLIEQKKKVNKSLFIGPDGSNRYFNGKSSMLQIKQTSMYPFP